MHDRLDAGFAVKALAETGVFEGYASVFDAIDDGHDRVRRGAFARTLAGRRPGDVKLLWQHDPTEPIGVIQAIHEDRRGLYVKARLLLDVARAREALSLMRCGALDGLSIGYRAAKATLDDRTGERLLEDIDLWEVSLVTFPMQRHARIAAFKTGAADDWAETEDWVEIVDRLTRLETLLSHPGDRS